ncbi:hypothetical protein F383_33000 [Gossypium arboreum]|uniref:Uncharacterized protein n=1 Tax=Gossypium arboreum TaxID=29729 RepID=A0A0B0MRP1_GOSAR|nr:hypothetical protein F383_22658 [Gossypium arboreum]KHG06888.1 hypothetical protein F383_33000 [Gossypium arboreum]
MVIHVITYRCQRPIRGLTQIHISKIVCHAVTRSNRTCTHRFQAYTYSASTYILSHYLFQYIYSLYLIK